MDDSFAPAIAAVKGKITERIAALQDDVNWQEIRKLYQGLGTLEELSGTEKTDLSALLGIATDTTGAAVGKYEFVTGSALDAAKQYLRKIAPKQKAASLQEIIEALTRGGRVLDAKGRDELRVSLSRSTTEIYKVSDDVYGLLEFFPDVKRQRGTPGRRSGGGQAGNGSADAAAAGEEQK